MDETRNLFAQGLGKILARSALVNSGNFEAHVILNPRAGGLRNEANRRRLMDEMGACTTGSHEARLWPVQIHLTERPGHGTEIAARIMGQSRGESKRVLLISVGGDGTHNECLSGLMLGSAEDRSRFLVFRFPLGTGNDGADAWTRIQALECLRDGHQQGSIGAVEVRRQGREPRYAFNIASYGIDAFVVEASNRIKQIVPGSFYKPMADMSVLVYLGFMKSSELHYIDGISGQTFRSSAVHGIIAMGVSGFRTYGHGIWVLPGRENLCVIRRGGLLRNLLLKQELYKASHVNLPETTVALSSNLTIVPSARGYIQVDGEVLSHDYLEGAIDFELIDTGITCLSAKELSKQYLSPEIMADGADYLKS